MKPIRCPYCDFEYTHFLGQIVPSFFEGRFRQGCIAAFHAYCENEPQHVFTVIIGEHKGQIILELLKAE